MTTEKQILKVMVVDGDLTSQRNLQRVLRRMEHVELTQAFKLGRQALNYLRQNEVDLMFLNPELKDLNGFDLLKSLESPPLTAMLSSRMEYAFFAFQMEVMDYLLLPLTSLQIEAVLEKAILQIRNQKIIADYERKLVENGEDQK